MLHKNIYYVAFREIFKLLKLTKEWTEAGRPEKQYFERKGRDKPMWEDRMTMPSGLLLRHVQDNCQVQAKYINRL